MLMKTPTVFALFALIHLGYAADPAASTFTGHFEPAKHTQSPFTIDITQTGKTAVSSFSAGNADGSGVAPDGDGDGTLNARGDLEFKWTDTFDNAGTATLRREGRLFHLSMKVSKAADPRALSFYGEITLKRTSTKPQMSTR
jgi:hypothetical protein